MGKLFILLILTAQACVSYAWHIVGGGSGV